MVDDDKKYGCIEEISKEELREMEKRLIIEKMTRMINAELRLPQNNKTIHILIPATYQIIPGIIEEVNERFKDIKTAAVEAKIGEKYPEFEVPVDQRFFITITWPKE
ncbi:MAG: hypothetical protein V1838_00610 [Patescibacteria group bacterium]